MKNWLFIVAFLIFTILWAYLIVRVVSWAVMKSFSNLIKGNNATTKQEKKHD